MLSLKIPNQTRVSELAEKGDGRGQRVTTLKLKKLREKTNHNSVIIAKRTEEPSPKKNKKPPTLHKTKTLYRCPQCQKNVQALMHKHGVYIFKLECSECGTLLTPHSTSQHRIGFCLNCGKPKLNDVLLRNERNMGLAVCCHICGSQLRKKLREQKINVTG
jgi:transcription elongation factor Elf1